jgi:hypothetical protein
VARTDARGVKILSDAGYPAGRVLETYKDYFDTLQQYWVVATHQGMKYRRVPGEGDTVHHIGGTSYLYKSFEKLDHWDYWPLAVHYFNLRILEFAGAAPFRTRFANLIDFHGSAESLLRRFPDFGNGWRKKSADEILLKLGARSIYTPEPPATISS